VRVRVAGTCLPICMAGYLLRYCGVRPVRVVFVESFCRVKTLSLTGRLLYYFADRFVVQWPQLKDKLAPRATSRFATVLMRL
jgi:beta-1,4-N-acetylglucosaminyltransferase